MGPAPAFSWQAASAGKTAASRSSASMRWIGGGLRRPPRWRSTTRARPRFHRHRTWNMGDSRSAWASVSSAVADVRKRGSSSSGRDWPVPSEMTTASSLAAACSSKSKRRQKRFRRARPRARLIRPPSGEWITSCIPPASSKNRSKTRSFWVGMTPSDCCAAAR